MNKILLFLLFAVWLPTMGLAENTLKGKPTATLNRKIVKELSGIIPASQAGDYWGISDSRNGAELYRLSINGVIQQRVQLNNARNTDWEAITRDNAGNLYIGDIGDNDLKRKDYCIFQIKEPAKGMQSSNIVTAYRFRYEDGKPHNCEGFFIDNQQFYIITKERHRKIQPQVFCLKIKKGNNILPAQKIGTLAIESPVTDAMYDKDKGILCILTYPQLYLFSVGQTLHFPLPEGISYKIKYDQCEGICTDGNSFILSNEKGNLWKFDLPAALLPK